MKEAVDEIIEPIIEPLPATRAPGAAPSSVAASGVPHHVFLIDGSGFIFRAYFARARSSEPVFQRKSDGMVTEVVTLFSNMLDKYRRETDADHMAVIFDASGSSFRNRIYDAYKQTGGKCRTIFAHNWSMYEERRRRLTSARSNCRTSRLMT